MNRGIWDKICDIERQSKCCPLSLAGSMTGRCKPTTTLKTGKTTNLFVRVFDYKFDHKNRPENFSPSRFLLPSSPFFLVIFKVERTKNRQGLYCSRYFPQVVFVVTSSENDRVKNFPVDFRGRIYDRTRAQNDRSIFQSLVRSMNPLGLEIEREYCYSNEIFKIFLQDYCLSFRIPLYSSSMYMLRSSSHLRK